MGLIRTAIDTIKGTLADQWADAIVPYNLDANTIMTPGMRQSNAKNANASANVITDGSKIQVGENQTMILVDGGKIIDYTAESGYFEVSNDKAPSMFNGQFGETLAEAFNRFKFGGAPSHSQQVYYINTQEIRDIPYGTQNPINYFDDFYNAELYLRAHGYYSIRVVNPLKFYGEMAPRATGRVTIAELQKICLSEFLTAFQATIGKMSIDGARISHINSKTMELAKYMQDILDTDWEERRGFRIESVGISSISYDEQSKKLIDLRNQGAMLSDPSIQQGYMAGATGKGIEAAGANPGGAGMGFLGVGMAGRVAEEMFPRKNQAQTAPQASAQPTGNTWKCSNCGSVADGKFCSTCGSQRATAGTCPKCHAQTEPGAKFCNQCGQAL